MSGSAPTTRPHLGRRLAAVILGVVAIGALGYLAAGAYIYDKLSHTPAQCDGRWPSHTPATFTVEGLDTAPYLMPEYEKVRFSSRDPAILIAAWYVPSPDPGAPAIVVVHGQGDCKRSPSVLLVAGMLHRHGFATLMVDLRDHGDSTIEDGRFAGGTDEYRDVLGAWDWLQADRGIVADRIGLVGISMGAATVMIATGEEPGVAATWEDSSYADIGVAISDELARNGYPTFLAPGGTLLARFASGDDLTTLSPLGAVAKLNGRPLFITHGDADQRLSVRYAHDLASALRTSGGNYELWIVPGSTHANAMVTNTQEYEQRLSDFFGRHLR